MLALSAQLWDTEHAAKTQLQISNDQRQCGRYVDAFGTTAIILSQDQFISHIWVEAQTVGDTSSTWLFFEGDTNAFYAVHTLLSQEGFWSRTGTLASYRRPG